MKVDYKQIETVKNCKNQLANNRNTNRMIETTRKVSEQLANNQNIDRMMETIRKISNQLTNPNYIEEMTKATATLSNVISNPQLISKINTSTKIIIDAINNQQELIQLKLSNIIEPTKNILEIFNKQQEALNLSISKLEASDIKQNLKLLEKTQNELFSLTQNQDLSIFDPSNILSIKLKNLNGNVSNEDKIHKLSKNIEYLVLTNEINLEKIKFLENLQIDNIEIEYIESNTNGLIPAEQILSKYISYAYSKSSKYSLTKAYEKSNIKKIQNLGENIINYIKDINLITFEQKGRYIFDTDLELVTLAQNIKNIVQSKEGFKFLSDYLYQGIYESAGGDNNRLYALTNHYQIDDNIISNIKSFRNLFDHRIKNGTKKVTKDIGYFEKTIKKKLPDCPSEWVKVQLQIYTDLENMLKQIFNKLNNDLSLEKLDLK